MKQPAGHARVRRSAPRKPVQLNLRRNTAPPEDELDDKPGNFWKWFALVFLVHVVGFIFLLLAFRGKPTPPPVQFISLLPAGDIAKGTPGAQAAPKVGPTTPAPSHAHSADQAPPTPETPPAQPPRPKVHHVKPAPVQPPPILKDDAPPVSPKPPPKPVPPRPKIKVDLSHLVDAPATDQPRPKLKPKLHAKKVVRPPDPSPDQDQAESDSAGLSRQQIAERLGEKLKAAGVDQGVTTGPNGSPEGRASAFSEFYASLRDQVMNKWSIPNLSDAAAVDPIVRIHVDRDGRVPPDSVTLERSSNNRVYDESALAAARSIGYTLQPLPDGCPPDISITFKPNR